MMMVFERLGFDRLQSGWAVARHWGRSHEAGIARPLAYVVVLAVTAALGFLCHGYVGPPG